MLTMHRAIHLSELKEEAYELNGSDSGCVAEEGKGRKPWSHVSYWECNHHIGHKWLPVLSSALVVLNEEMCASVTSSVWSQKGRLCLDRLVRYSRPSNRSSLSSIPYSSPSKQRRRLSHEGISLLLLPKGRILLSNMTTESPIFVASPCFVQAGDPIGSDWPVYRVAPACSLVVFDACVYEDRLMEMCSDTRWPGKSLFGPVLHISLGKGWGPAYRRIDFTHCPARLEVWLNLARIKSHGDGNEEQ